MSSFHLQTLLHSATRLLTDAVVDAPRLCAECLLAHALGLSRQDFLRHYTREPQSELTLEAALLFQSLLARRALGEPLAYILEEKEFFSRDFVVSPATLIPRPETELLIEFTLKQADRAAALRLADLGTGSGCIAVTLAVEAPLWTLIAVDMSLPALAVAQKNATKHAVAERVHCWQADFCQPIFAAQSLDGIISNPPYVSAEEYATLSPEVRCFEPKEALVPTLDAGITGTEYALPLITHSHRALRSGAFFAMEMGWQQADAVASLFLPELWQDVTLIHDLAGIARHIVAVKR